MTLKDFSNAIILLEVSYIKKTDKLVIANNFYLLALLHIRDLTNQYSRKLKVFAIEKFLNFSQ